MFLTNPSGATTPRILLACVLLASVAGTAAAAPQQGSGDRRVTVRARTCTDCADQDSLRRAREALLVRVDSLRWEVEHRRLTDDERHRVAQEITRTLRALEVSMAEAMRRGSVVISAEAGARAAQRGAEALAYVEAAPRVRGYLGVTFDGPWTESSRSDQRVIRFYQYPRIALVEAASPAERAGVLVGDTLLALNGTDVREREISFTKLLVPNNRITMRVLRDGNPRDLRITVGETPEFYVRRLTPVAPRAGAVAVAPEPPDVPRARAVGGVRPAPAPPVPQQGYVYWFGNDALAGARLETITGGLARALDVADGVLVIRTAPGSPAYESGLREGDVVTHVGTEKVRTVNELQRRVEEAGKSDVRLVIVRDRKRREITLRW